MSPHNTFPLVTHLRGIEIVNNKKFVQENSQVTFMSHIKGLDTSFCHSITIEKRKKKEKML